MSISIRLEELRREAGLNKAETAKALGLSYKTYIGYESGKREPRSKRLIKIAKFFGVSVDYLLGRTKAKNWHSN